AAPQQGADEAHRAPAVGDRAARRRRLHAWRDRRDAGHSRGHRALGPASCTGGAAPHLEGRSERPMTDFRLISNDEDDGDASVVRGLRSLYAAPAGDAYWNELEARIMARVADVELGWWTELDRWVRPAIAAAAVLLIAAGAAMFRARQAE